MPINYILADCLLFLQYAKLSYNLLVQAKLPYCLHSAIPLRIPSSKGVLVLV